MVARTTVRDCPDCSGIVYTLAEAPMADWFDKTQPLWLPKGSVRALLAIFTVVVGLAYLVATGGDLETLVLLVLGWYFITRAAVAGAKD